MDGSVDQNGQRAHRDRNSRKVEGYRRSRSSMLSSICMSRRRIRLTWQIERGIGRDRFSHFCTTGRMGCLFLERYDLRLSWTKLNSNRSNREGIGGGIATRAIDTVVLAATRQASFFQRVCRTIAETI